MNPTIQKLIVPAIVVVLVAVLGVGLLRPASNPTTALEGRAAPDFTLKLLDGGELALSSLRGRPVIVNFFASWCIPCRDEAPLLNATALEHAKKGLVIVGVAYSDKPDDTRKFKNDFSLGFPVLMDSDDSRASVQYGIKGVPETFFIMKDGVIQSYVPGPVDGAKLQAGLKKIL